MGSELKTVGAMLFGFVFSLLCDPVAHVLSNALCDVIAHMQNYAYRSVWMRSDRKLPLPRFVRCDRIHALLLVFLRCALAQL